MDTIGSQFRQHPYAGANMATPEDIVGADHVEAVAGYRAGLRDEAADELHRRLGGLLQPPSIASEIARSAIYARYVGRTSEEHATDPKRIVADGYDRLGPAFSSWVAQNPAEVRSWFLREALARLPEGSDVLELGSGPGTAAMELSAGRRYTGVDLSRVQLGFAQRRVPSARFVRADFTTPIFRPERFDGVVAFYVFNHVPREEVSPALAMIFAWLRSGGRLMMSLGASDDPGGIEPDWLGVPMYFAGFSPETNDRLLGEAGFELEVSETHEEITTGPSGGPERFHWVIARKPRA